MSHVFWITGLSAAGKTTLAKLVVNRLRNLDKAVVLLDGDLLREAMGFGDGHDRAGRLRLAYKYAGLAKMIATQDVVVVVSAVALFKEIHEWNRNNLPGYFEVFMKVNLDELRKRDPKGIYASYDKGQIKNVAGLDLDVDEPQNPDLLIEYSPGQTPEMAFGKLWKRFEAVNPNINNF